MLNTQVAYWANQEQKRHNLAQEDVSNRSLEESKRHNLRTEQWQFGSLGEQTRHNKATESWQSASLAETTRHNRASESISWSQLFETSRHNQQQEAIGWGSLGESIRHNQANEAEQRRHNLQDEDTRKYDATTRRITGIGHVVNESVNTLINGVSTFTRPISSLAEQLSLFPKKQTRTQQYYRTFSSGFGSHGFGGSQR